MAEKSKAIGVGEMVNLIAEDTRLSKTSIEAVFDSLSRIVVENLEHGKRVQFTNFGVFELKKKAPRTGRNPRTGEVIKIDARNCPVFTPAKKLVEFFKDLT